MENLKYIVLIMAFGLFSCSSQKKLQTQTPFEIGNVTCQEYIGGMEKSGTGMTLRIPVTIDPTAEIEMMEVFFRGKKATVSMEEMDGKRYAIAKIPNSKGGSSETVDLNLALTEAVLSFKEKGKLKYTKITDIKQKQPLIYKSIPKN